MKNSKAQRVAQTGLLFALAITLSWLESGIAPLLGLMPAMKLGLANMVVMYALLFLPLRAAWALVFGLCHSDHPSVVKIANLLW